MWNRVKNWWKAAQTWRTTPSSRPSHQNGQNPDESRRKRSRDLGANFLLLDRFERREVLSASPLLPTPAMDWVAELAPPIVESIDIPAFTPQSTLDAANISAGLVAPSEAVLDAALVQSMDWTSESWALGSDYLESIEMESLAQTHSQAAFVAEIAAFGITSASVLKLFEDSIDDLAWVKASFGLAA